MLRIVALLVALCALPLRAANFKLNLFMSGDSIDPEVITDFEKRHDAKVTIDSYENEAAMIARLQNGGGQYDVVVPPDHAVPTLIKLRLIAPLRPQNIPNMRNIDERFASPWYDPGNRFTVPCQWGTLGIYLRESPDKTNRESWALFFEEKEQPGPFVLMDGMRDAIGAVLKYKGRSLNSTNVIELGEALDVLAGARKRSLGFENSADGMNKVLTKSAAAAMVYSSDAMRGMREDPETYFFVPKEGSQIWVDNLAVCAQAPNRIVAEKFLNFILNPAIGARLADYNQTATPNKAALTFVHPDNHANPIIYPPTDVQKRLELLRNVGMQTRFYDDVWISVKARQPDSSQPSRLE